MSIEILNLCDILQKERDKYARIRAKVEKWRDEAKRRYRFYESTRRAGWRENEAQMEAYQKILDLWTVLELKS